MQYGNFTFIEFSEPKIRANGIKRKRAIFKCSCGDVRSYDFCAVKTGHTTKCWVCSHKNVGKSKETHKLSSHPLYSKWRDMKNRCYNPKVDRYGSYGALGITVCDEWKNDFKCFYDWSISAGWTKGLSIERKDVYGNYCPDNCKYIPIEQQKYNLKTTFYIEYKGVKLSLKKLNNESDFKVYKRIYEGSKKGRDLNYYLKKINGFKDFLDVYIEKRI